MKKKTNFSVFLRFFLFGKAEFAKPFTLREKRSVRIAGLSCGFNLIVGFVKLFLGVVTLSFFTCANAFYTLGVVAAKFFAVSGIFKTHNNKAQSSQYKNYFISGIISIFSSALYIVYSIRLFLNPVTAFYHEYVAIAIAAVTFFEIFINIRGVITERKNNSPLFHAVKMINLSGSFISFALTQAALLSFTSDQTHLHPTANGLIGIIVGVVAMALGVFMLIRITKLEQRPRNISVCRKVKRCFKREGIDPKITKVKYNKTDNRNLVIVNEKGSRGEMSHKTVSRVKKELGESGITLLFKQAAERS